MHRPRKYGISSTILKSILYEILLLRKLVERKNNRENWRHLYSPKDKAA